MDLSIIIVNWNSAEYVRKCLLSICSDSIDIDYEIIVVDNASYDQCRSIIKSEFPDVCFVQSKENIGFARANNLGYEHSNGDVLLFLNPDTEVCNQAIYKMYNALKSTKDAGGIGCKLLNSNKSLQTSCVQPFPTLLNQILDVEFLKLAAPSLKLWGMNPLYQSDLSLSTVQVVSGACLMIKRSVFQAIDKFSIDYFMYTEDIDICFKIHQAGYKIYYLNDAKVVHHGGGSSQNKGNHHFSDVLMSESIWTFIRKYRGNLTAFAYRFLVFFNASARIFLLNSLFYVPRICGSARYPKHIASKWMNILRWSLGLEKWARELNKAGSSSQIG